MSEFESSVKSYDGQAIVNEIHTLSEFESSVKSYDGQADGVKTIDQAKV